MGRHQRYEIGKKFFLQEEIWKKNPVGRRLRLEEQSGLSLNEEKMGWTTMNSAWLEGVTTEGSEKQGEQAWKGGEQWLIWVP